MRTVSIVTSCLSLFAFSESGNAQSNPDEILLQFRAIQKLVVHATVEVVVNDPEICDCVEQATSISGEFDFYADGDNWRLNSSLDPELYCGMQTDLAWNGAMFQYLARDTSLLGITTGVLPGADGLTLPNPLSELMQHDFPVTDANSVRQARFTEVRAKAQATTYANVTRTSVLVDGRTLERAEFPGGTYEGQTYTHRVYTRPGQPGRPLQIDRVNQQGQLLTRSKFDSHDRFLTGSGTYMYWPRSVHFEIRDPQTGNVGYEITFAIGTVAVNVPSALPTNIFSIGWDQANTVVLDGLIVQQP